MSHGIAFMRLEIPQRRQSFHLVENCCRKLHTTIKTKRRGPSDVSKHLSGLEFVQRRHPHTPWLSVSISLRKNVTLTKIIPLDLHRWKYFGSSIQSLLWFMASGLLSILRISSFLQRSVTNGELCHLYALQNCSLCGRTPNGKVWCLH